MQEVLVSPAEGAGQGGEVEFIEVMVPDGCGAGDLLYVICPGGRELEVDVPDDVQARAPHACISTPPPSTHRRPLYTSHATAPHPHTRHDVAAEPPLGLRIQS